MQDDLQRQILNAFLVAIKPIARMLLRFGIGYREFSEIAKLAFVHVASTEFGLRGRPTNISRVAAMTGLTRKEVSSVREKMQQGDVPVTVKSTPLSEILHRWHSESEFLDHGGRPAILPFVGERNSFSSLVKRFGGDIPPGAMRTELKRVKAIAENEDGELFVVSRVIQPAGDHEKLITAVIHALYPLASTIAQNVNSDRRGEPWTQINAYSQSIRTTDLPRLRRITHDRLTDIAESIDDLFMAYETLHGNDGAESEKSTVVVGVYYFEDSDEGVAKIW